MERNMKIVIIAGPNGAGKTTFAREFLPTEAGRPAVVNTARRLRLWKEEIIEHS